MEKTNEENKIRSDSPEINLPPVIFGTSGLGNLFVALNEETKCEIISECFRLSNGTVVFDSAGKYGAGLALEVLGRCLKKLNVSPDQVVISNKLAWLRTELKTPEPTFEPGVWKDLTHDAIQKISYEGIMECFEQGNMLLGDYPSQLVSVHDPDEYLATAKDLKEAELMYDDVLGAYRALYDLKKQGKVKAIGLGAKNWKIIRRIAGDVRLDWVMIANSMTIKSHPKELLDFMTQLEQDGVAIINAAVFHSGFLVGSNYFDYKLMKPGTAESDDLYKWRDEFFTVCRNFNVRPAAACIQFGLHAPGVKSIALNTTEVKRVRENIEFANTEIPVTFWETLKSKGLISVNFFEK
ncbi:MAG: aldo/keto reductase [Bacteroidia bacterium]|nr:aldo/keto reductase [Bacteroidia bacterium]